MLAQTSRTALLDDHHLRSQGIEERGLWGLLLRAGAIHVPPPLPGAWPARGSDAPTDVGDLRVVRVVAQAESNHGADLISALAQAGGDAGWFSHLARLIEFGCVVAAEDAARPASPSSMP